MFAFLFRIQRLARWLVTIWPLRFLAALWTAGCAVGFFHLVWVENWFPIFDLLVATSGLVAGYLVLPYFLSHREQSLRGRISDAFVGGCATTVSVAVLFSVLLSFFLAIAEGGIFYGALAGFAMSPLFAFFGALFGFALIPVGGFAAVFLEQVLTTSFWFWERVGPTSEECS